MDLYYTRQYPMTSNYSRQKQLSEFRSRNLLFARHKVCVFQKMINKSTDNINYTAAVREIGNQIHHNLLKCMAWWLLGMQWALQYLSYHLCYLAHLTHLTILATILLHTMPVVPFTKITYYTIWAKVS